MAIFYEFAIPIIQLSSYYAQTTTLRFSLLFHYKKFAHPYHIRKQEETNLPLIGY